MNDFTHLELDSCHRLGQKSKKIRTLSLNSGMDSVAGASRSKQVRRSPEKLTIFFEFFFQKKRRRRKKKKKKTLSFFSLAVSPFHSFFPCTHALSRWAHKVKRPLSLSLSLSLAASLGSGRAGLTRMTWFLNVSWKFRSKKNTQGKGTKRKTQKDLFFLFFFFSFSFFSKRLEKDLCYALPSRRFLFLPALCDATASVSVSALSLSFLRSSSSSSIPSRLFGCSFIHRFIDSKTLNESVNQFHITKIHLRFK